MSKRHRLDIGDSSAKMPKTEDGAGGQHIEGAPTEQDLINIKKVRRVYKCNVFKVDKIYIYMYRLTHFCIHPTHKHGLYSSVSFTCRPFSHQVIASLPKAQVSINPYTGIPYTHRYHEVLKKRMTLPVWEYKDKFIEILSKNQCFVLVGETGLKGGTLWGL